jgi:hypothetical protein
MTNKIRFAAALLVVALAAICASAQAPTLRIQTDDPNLPSDLYYGNVKVKPLRLRPGTNQPVTIDDNDFMVQQQYIDFLGRMPDSFGFPIWLSTLSNCPAGDITCDRGHVSEQFVRSPEFQLRGYFTFRFYPVSFPGQAGSDPPGFGHKPSFAEFLPDLRSISGFLDANQLEAAKLAFVNGFMARPAFVARYNFPNTPTGNQQYVDLLLNTAGVTLSQRQSLIDGLTNSTLTRGQVLRQIAESTEVSNKYYNESVVVMQYFGYLRRDPDAFYFGWLAVLDANPTDSRGMVSGFFNSTEYRQRF